MSGWPCCRPAAVVDSTRAVASGGRPRRLAYRLGMPEGKKEACGGGGRGERERESPARARGGGGRWGWAPAEKRPRGNVRAQGSADDRVIRVDAEEACGRQASCKGGADVFPIRSAEEACGGARAYGGCEAGAKRNGHRRGVPTTRAHVRATPSIMIAGVRARLRARWHARLSRGLSMSTADWHTTPMHGTRASPSKLRSDGGGRQHGARSRRS